MLTIRKYEVVGLGARVPRIPMNLYDSDYEMKSSNPENYLPAVIVRLAEGEITAVVIREDQVNSLKVGDFVSCQQFSLR
jgi:hypothetical protein